MARATIRAMVPRPEDRQRRSPHGVKPWGTLMFGTRGYRQAVESRKDLGLILAFRRRTDTDGVGVLQRERACALLRELRVFSLRKSRGAWGARLRGVSNGRHEVLPSWKET